MTRLLVRNLATGKAVNGGPTPVRTTADGSVHIRLGLDLSDVRSVDVSIWTKQGNTLTMAAQDRAEISCGHLPRTGVAVGRRLELGLGLLGLGGMLVWWTRRPRRRRPAAA